MKYHKQLYRHDPEKGSYGDYQRTVYACLLDKAKADDVPHFGCDLPSSGVFWDRVDGWLRRQGYTRFSWYFDSSVDRATVTRTVGQNNPGIYYMLAGLSPRGTQHVVICLGDAVLHDPHPAGGGIVAPGEDGLWCVEVLVPLRLTEKRRLTLGERWPVGRLLARLPGAGLAKRRGRSWNSRKHDRHCGPFTYSTGHEHVGIVLRSGSSGRRPCLQFSFGKHTLICEMPRWCIKPWRRWVDTSTLQTYDADGPRPLTVGGYWDAHPREYGFNVHKSERIGDGSYDFLSVSLGAQTMDSSTTQNWCCELPWMAWRHTRISLLAPNGLEWAVLRDPRRPLWFRGKARDAYRRAVHENYDARRQLEDLAPKKQYLFADYDGEHITATCRVTESEWRRGEGWFAWLSAFYAPKVMRHLNLDFSKETGRRKGSWKGGTLSSSGPLRNGEHGVEAAFRAYCERESMTFLGELPSDGLSAQ